MALKMQVPRKLLPFVTTRKRYKVAYGGRGGAKSMTFSDMLSKAVQTEGALVGCIREYQNSLEDSVYSLLNARISHLGIPGFKKLNNKIDHVNGGGFRFKGLARSISAIKSIYGFKYFWLEEGQFISEDSLKILTPTLREEDSELWISANPGSKFDPFSQRFIVPFEKELNSKGFYEDDMHYIVKINYPDNPWFPETLEAERALDFKILPRAMYDHIWLGDFNDSVNNALIRAEWFDACVDAHLALGFTAKGAIIAAHDPSDKGEDPKGLCIRHGSVVLEVLSNAEGDINEGGDWAAGLAITYNADVFTWDCDGMGVGLNRQVKAAFDGKHVRCYMFKGSETPDFPEKIYDSVDGIADQKKTKDALKNKRAQYYFELRNRVLRTYKAVTNHEYFDPESMISFSSGITEMSNLRSELCKMPIKPNTNGLLELYTKEVMKTKFKLQSPNLADSVMMSMRVPYFNVFVPDGVIPSPIKSMGVGTSLRRV